MKKILFINGSLRKNSFQAQMADFVAKQLKDVAEVQFLEYSDIPFMNQDIEYPAPEAVQRVREDFAKADGIWVFSPEYNHGLPGHLKNLFDWMSRLHKPFDFQTPSSAAGKKITASGVGGNDATKFLRKNLYELLTFIKMDVLDEYTGAVANAEAWGGASLELTEEVKESLKSQAKNFLAFIG